MKNTKNSSLKAVLLTTLTLATITACAGSGESKLSANEDTLNEPDSASTLSAHYESSNPALADITKIESEILELSPVENTNIDSTVLDTQDEASDFPTQYTLYFSSNISDVNNGDFELIKQHAEFLRLNPNIMVSINGHADSQGGEKYNMNLSQKRADAIADLLIQHGVSESQLILAAYGETVPATTLSDWKANRRVELEYSDLVTLSSR